MYLSGAQIGSCKIRKGSFLTLNSRGAEFKMYGLKCAELPRIFLGFPLMVAFVLISLMGQPIARSQDHPMDHEHGGMSMMMDGPMDPAAQAKRLQDKKESEFNHHLAGFFVLLAGIFILFEEPFMRRWPAVRYALPLCFYFQRHGALAIRPEELAGRSLRESRSVAAQNLRRDSAHPWRD